MVTYSDLFQFCILIHSQKSTKLEHIGIQITHCFCSSSLGIQSRKFQL